MKIKKIKGNTFVMDAGMSYIPFYKISDKEIIMMDSGWAKGQREVIDEILEINDFKVIGIICSHAHIDHVGNNAYLKEKYNCTIAMPAYGAITCSSAINLKVYYSGQTLSEVTEHFGHMVCKTDIMIMDDQDSVDVCGVKFKILHTPGHSPGHICITTPDDVAYLADSLISYEVMKGAKMPYAFILKEDLKSKVKLYDLNCSKYIVAHKGIYDNIEKLITDNINFYKERAERICDLIEGVMAIEDILKNVIKNFNIPINNRYKYTVIERMLKSYVEYLVETGAVELKTDNGFPKYIKCQSNSSYK